MAALKFLAPLTFVALFAVGLRADDKPKTDDKPKPEAKPGFIGIRLDNSDDKSIRVLEIVENGPAAKGGLKAGDIVLKIDGKNVDGVENFVRTVRSHKPGDKITLTVKRDDKEMEVKITAGEAPPQPTDK